MAPVGRQIQRAVKWWVQRPDIVKQIEGFSFDLDRTLVRLEPESIDLNPYLRSLVSRLQIAPEDLLAYQALAEGPYGQFRVAAIFFLAPELLDPSMICLDGPRGTEASDHRYDEVTLCLYYRKDPPERRWKPDDTLIRLFDLARAHLLAEYYWRETGEWPLDEAPHGETAPARSNPSLLLPPMTRRPGSNEYCSCKSGKKAKRCCYQ